jgi:hypothetical protein
LYRLKKGSRKYQIGAAAQECGGVTVRVGVGVVKYHIYTIRFPGTGYFSDSIPPALPFVKEEAGQQ